MATSTGATAAAAAASKRPHTNLPRAPKRRAAAAMYSGLTSNPT